MSSTKEEKGILKLVHPGGHIETYTQPVRASEIMKKNPRHRVTRPDVFKFPWLVVRPDSFLQPGKVFYVVPEHTIYHLLKTHHHQSSSRSPNQHGRPPTPRKDSPRRIWAAGMTPKHGSRTRKRRDDQSEVGCAQPSCLVPWNASFAKNTTKVAAERQEVPKNMERPRTHETRPTTTSTHTKSKDKKKKRGKTMCRSSLENRGLKPCLRQPGIGPKSRNRIVTFSEPEAIWWDQSQETIKSLEYEFSLTKAVKRESADAASRKGEDMEAYLWIRRNLSRPKTTNFSSSAVAGDGKKQSSKIDEEEAYGVTDQLIDFVKAFNLETFRNSPFQDEQGSSRDNARPRAYENVRKDLSDWQERHASLVLSKVKELSQLRFRLCPRYLNELQFWRVYFKLVKSYVSEYELRAVRAEKLKQMAMGMEESFMNRSSYEVEMAETNQFISLVPSKGLDSPSSDLA